jgi:oligopeptide/dipeptide ABC transporter ATP-binding protein
VLEVRDLTVRYAGNGGWVTAARGVGFGITTSEIVGLVGESGSGKTTVARALLGLLPPGAEIHEGSIRFRGSELRTLDEEGWTQVRGAEISLVLQEPGIALNPVLRVGDQIQEVVRAHGDVTPGQRRERVRAVLEKVGLADVPHVAEAYPHELSGGQRQRAALAQALVAEPALVVADEPTTGLDPITQAEIRALFRALREELGCAFLLVSHDPAFLATLSDRILVMYAGHVVEEGPTRRVLREPLHPYTRGLLGSRGAGPDRRRTAQDWRADSIPGSPPDPLQLPPGCAFEPRCGQRKGECRERWPPETRPDPKSRVRCFVHGG